jgi:GTPase SAR1 family protein
MKQADVYIMVFSLTNRSSFDHVLELYDQTERVTDGARRPVILVGNKHDLGDERVITYEEACALAERIGADAYIETSAKQRVNVDEPFDEAIRGAVARIEARNNLGRSGKDKEGCFVM